LRLAPRSTAEGVSSGSIVLLAGISIAFKHQFGIGGGALERLTQYPESVWLILFGLYISRDHYRNGVVGSRLKFSMKNLLTARSTQMDHEAADATTASAA